MFRIQITHVRMTVRKPSRGSKNRRGVEDQTSRRKSKTVVRKAKAAAVRERQRQKSARRGKRNKSVREDVRVPFVQQTLLEESDSHVMYCRCELCVFRKEIETDLANEFMSSYWCDDGWSDDGIDFDVEALGRECFDDESDDSLPARLTRDIRSDAHYWPTCPCEVCVVIRRMP